MKNLLSYCSFIITLVLSLPLPSAYFYFIIYAYYIIFQVSKVEYIRVFNSDVLSTLWSFTRFKCFYIFSKDMWLFDRYRTRIKYIVPNLLCNSKLFFWGSIWTHLTWNILGRNIISISPTFSNIHQINDIKKI